MSTEQKPQTRDRSKTIIIILSAIIVLQAIKIISDYSVRQTLETTTADLTETRTRLEEIKTELDQKIEQLQKNELEATELLYINSPAEGNYRAMELGKYAPFVSKYILLPNTVRNGLTASQQIKLADDIQPIGLVFGINHFLQSNDDWFILEHDDIDPGITVLVNRKNVTNAFS